MSFSDLMSSGRGPGVIGMVMALFVLLGFGLLFTLAFDEGFQGEGITIEAEIANQAKAINGYMSQSEAGNLQLAGTSVRLATATQILFCKIV